MSRSEDALDIVEHALTAKCCTDLGQRDGAVTALYRTAERALDLAGDLERELAEHAARRAPLARRPAGERS